jgi:hypothetical protein
LSTRQHEGHAPTDDNGDHKRPPRDDYGSACAVLYQDEGGHVSTDGVLTAGPTAQALLDALPDATAVLEHGGVITAVNRAWRMFALDNGGEPTRTCIGADYLEVRTRSATNGCPEATAIATGLHAVLDGHAVHSEFEYPCPTPTAELSGSPR